MSMSSSPPLSACPYCSRPRVAGARFCIHCGKSFAVTTGTTATQGPVRSMAARMRGRSRSDLTYVIVAALLAVILSDLPFVNVLVHPFRLFETLVHEWAHALMAIVTGGAVEGLEINPNDLSGETITTGGWSLPIFSAGYVGASVAGALLLLTPTRFANRTLIGIGITAGLMPVIALGVFHTQFPLTTWFWTGLFSIGALAVGVFAIPRIARILQQFIAVQLCFKAIDDLRYLAWHALNVPHSCLPTNTLGCSDAYNAEHLTGIPEIVWVGLWSVIAVAAIGFSLVQIVRRSFTTI